MKVLWLILFAVCGYYAWSHFSPPTAPPPASLPPEKSPSVRALPPIDSYVRTRLVKLYEEWTIRNAGTERRQLGTSFNVDMAGLLSEIKLRGPHTDRGVEKLIMQLLPELGVQADELKEVAKGILTEAKRDGSKGGHNRAY